MMDREVIVEKKETNKKGDGFMDKIKAMFCAGPTQFEM